ncbi:hypothetical protein N9N67_05360 [Bacteriovoracaceae bacterium]|nr:hypothetical protein [Bacteriovoracaceae bacterium]
MYARIIGLFFILLLSCQERPTRQLYNFFDQINHVDHIRINPFFSKQSNKYLPNDREIWLFEYKKFNQQNYCLYMKLFRDQKKLSLSLVNAGIDNCDSLRGKKIDNWKMFSKFGFIDVISVENFVRLNFQHEKKVVSISLERDIHHFLSQNGLLLNGNMTEYLLNLPKLKDGDYCQKFDDDCNEIKLDKCYSCKSSWSFLLEGSCKEKINKVCGSPPCGALNQRACLRAQKNPNYKGELCQKGSAFGFCHEGLEVQCEGGKLVCRNY